LDGLQHHFIIDRLVEVRKSESSDDFEELPCEICAEENDEIATVTKYCLDCNQMLCDQCSRPHTKTKGENHRIRTLGAERRQELLHHIEEMETACEKHKDKEAELYCHDCKENICVLCFATKHRSHNNGEIPEVADNFRLRIDEDDQRILSVINGARQQSEQAQEEGNKFLSKAEDVKRKVLATGDVVKHSFNRSVDDQTNEMLMKLESVKSESVKQSESVQLAYQQALVAMESFHTHSRELLDKGRPSDITRAGCELHDRATELLDSDVTAVKYRPPHVTFTPTDVTQVKCLNLIGELTVTSEEQTGRSYQLYSNK